MLELLKYQEASYERRTDKWLKRQIEKEKEDSQR
jgi:hypothetical protein